MKRMKRILALLVAVVMVFGMSMSALAVSISVEQDSSYGGTENAAGRTYSYKQIFRATKNGTSTSEGGGYDADGTPGEVTQSDDNTADAFSYYLLSTDTAQVGQLGTWNAENKTWTKASGNEWFKLTLSADGSRYTVEWDNAKKDTDTVQKAAAWLDANYTALASGSLTWNSSDKKWTADNLPEGYYLLKSDTGSNLIAATTDIDVKEKNDYPPIDKTQADEDDDDVSEDQSDADRNVAIGDTLTYEVKVTIPKTAAVGNVIIVYDTPSKGLTYNNDVEVKSNDGEATVVEATGDDVVAGAAWTQKITVTAGSQGKDVIFKFTMTVNTDALTDSDKENESALKYGNNYDSLPDAVKFKTYYGGIHKVDAADTTKDLDGIEFTLKEDGTEFKVTKHADGYYYPDAQNGSSTVVTDTDGMIMIRGLDDDKTYTLTETKTKDGYNMLKDDVTLVLHEDTVTTTTADGQTSTTSSFENAADTDWGLVKNEKGIVLPSTGGIGTTLFYVVGAILVVGAGVILVARRRMNSK